VVLCTDCLGNLPFRERQVTRAGLPSGTSWIDYEAKARALLHVFKTTGSSAIAKILTEQIWPNAESIDRTMLGARVLVPTPSSRRANRIRGFSPSQVFAQALAKRAGLLGRYLVVLPILSFRRKTDNQKRLDKAARIENLKSAMTAIAADSRTHLGAGAVLVDDVITTGATLSEASRALTQAGWKLLTFITFAETL
jgi:predicted amidophosphoribosyltransferase